MVVLSQEGKEHKTDEWDTLIFVQFRNDSQLIYCKVSPIVCIKQELVFLNRKNFYPQELTAHY